MDLDWRQGYNATYYATFVDPDSWADGERIELTNGSIKKTTGDLLESADVGCVSYTETTERWIRIWLDARQDANSSHVALFTGVAMSPGRNIDGRKESNTLQCYSVLKPAQDILLDRGYYVPIGIDGGYMVKTLLSDLRCPVEISGNVSDKRNISKTIVAEQGESKLSMAWKILQAMDWRLLINGRGEVYAGPYDKTPVIAFGANDNDVIEPTLTVEYDWYDCPNVFRAVMDDQIAIARDTNPDSSLSIPTRGREIWYEEVGCILNDKETLQEYADRRLKELQRTSLKVNYDRRGIFDPVIFPTDVITLSYPIQKITGNFLVASQTINLDFGARTSEEVIML